MTIRSLAKYLKKSESSLYYMRKTNPKQFELIWLGRTIKKQMMDNNKR